MKEKKKKVEKAKKKRKEQMKHKLAEPRRAASPPLPSISFLALIYVSRDS